jgi:hypothetical protein
MNNFKAIEVDYLRPSRTIETILVSNDNLERIFFVYNYEGNYFRVFESIIDLINFFDENIESKIYFENESDLDNYLLNVKLN